MSNCVTLFYRIILEVLMVGETDEGKIAAALLRAFESHHDRMCGMVQERITAVERTLESKMAAGDEELKAIIIPLVAKVETLSEEAASFKGSMKMLKIILTLLPILCTIGAAAGALIGGK